MYVLLISLFFWDTGDYDILLKPKYQLPYYSQYLAIWNCAQQARVDGFDWIAMTDADSFLVSAQPLRVALQQWENESVCRANLKFT